MTVYMPERILVAPSGFKESLSAIEVSAAIAAGVRRVYPGVHVDTYPVPDGGEGTLEILATRAETIPHTLEVTGPVGRSVTATWLELPNHTGVIEMASAAGLRLVPYDQRDPGATTTYGVGQLIVNALDHGMRHIIVGCGDSGTSDGGAGALQALGVRILDARGAEIPTGGAALIDAAAVDTSGLHPAWKRAKVQLACNMHNVFTGPRGVAAVFGPQKGASPEQVSLLDAALTNFARLLTEHCSPTVDLYTGPGTGASGGLGAGLAALGAQLENRFDVLLGSVSAGPTGSLDELITQADLIITAEGAIDFQTPHGKVPAEIARRAQTTGVPVLALAGSLGKGAPSVHDVGISAIASIMNVPMDFEQAVKNGGTLLADATERTMRLIQLGSAINGRSARKALKLQAV